MASESGNKKIVIDELKFRMDFLIDNQKNQTCRVRCLRALTLCAAKLMKQKRSEMLNFLIGYCKKVYKIFLDINFLGRIVDYNFFEFVTSFINTLSFNTQIKKLELFNSCKINFLYRNFENCILNDFFCHKIFFSSLTYFFYVNFRFQMLIRLLFDNIYVF